MFSIMPRHNYLSRPRPNCERRCSIRHSSIEGYQLEKCFQKTPRCLLTLAPGDCSDCCQAQGHLSTLVKFTFREDPEIRSVFAWSTTNQQSDIHHTTYLSSTLLVKVRWWSVGQGKVKSQKFSDKSLTLVNSKLVSKLWWKSQHVMGLSPQTSNKHYILDYWFTLTFITV
mgnify:FL=1